MRVEELARKVRKLERKQFLANEMLRLIIDTMLSLIQKYADKHNMNVYITPVEKKLETYEKLYNSCLSMIAQIVRNHGAFDEQWANNPFCLQLFDVIGTGAELQDFKMLRLEVQTPIKEYPDPVQENNYNFTFKPVNRNSAVNFS